VFAGRLDEALAALAYHYFEAGAWPQAEAYARRAGEQAVAHFAPHEARAHFSRAIEAAERQGHRPPADLLRARGQASEIVGDFAGAQADLEAALAAARAAGDQPAEWQLLLDLGQLWAGRDYARTGECFQAALSLARAMGDPQRLGQSLNRMGNWQLNRDEVESSLAYHHEALALFEAAGEARGLADTLDLLGLTYGNQGDLSRARAQYERALPLFRALDDRRGESSALSVMADLAAIYATDTAVPALSVREARAVAETSLRLAQAIGWRAGEAYSQIVLGANWLAAGYFDQAERAIRQGESLATEIGHHQWMAAAGVVLGELLAERLDLRAARDQLQQARDLALRINSTLWRRFSGGLLVQVLVLLGETAEAEAVLKGEPGPEAGPRSVAERLMVCAWAEVALARGEAGRALALMERTAAETLNLGPGRVPPRVWWSLGRVLAGAGRLDEAARVFGENVAANPELKLFNWQQQAELSRLHAALGRPGEAAQAAEEARRLIQAVASTLNDEQQRSRFAQRALARLAAPAGETRHG
jgi:tetratricopeptide (TPR) repeat protein